MGMMKELVGCVQAMVGKKTFLLQFKDVYNKEMSSFSLQYLCSKEKVCLEMDEPISNLPKK